MGVFIIINVVAVLMMNNMGSGLDEQFCLLLYAPPIITHNYSTVAISTLGALTVT
jgi:hypothetical protein